MLNFLNALIQLTSTTMAWRCTGKSNKELISNMATAGIFKSDQVANVDRANYVRHATHFAFSKIHPHPEANLIPEQSGMPQQSARRTWSVPLQSQLPIPLTPPPSQHAYATEHLLPYLRPGARVLDVGSGSGYLCAVLHHLVGPTGKVVGIEHIPELVDWSVDNLKKDGLGKALEDGSIVVVAGDGRKGPYDAIHVGAAAPTLPNELVEQLACPGRMFIPVGTYSQYIQHVDKDANGKVTHKEVMGVSYVPLTDQEKQRGV
ncbi:hypothetical protein D9615_006054 [Tricholomella constricta]|uniref:protein-L-isoaspartate(D-aspartate) O-methyltransferase n=1 Tax=Tricholomella constricta TaxID=117010 RepID=A0A8H5M357_9AGAR|nr:hypothetical protein D9615_006054 [Tricholomella constricta]